MFGYSSGVRGLMARSSGAASFVGLKAAQGTKFAGRKMGGTRGGSNLGSNVLAGGNSMLRNQKAVGAGIMGMGAGAVGMGMRGGGSQNYPMY